ncbi:uncharacterized protein [Nothobranchius furzeri]|uniref:uncharacterized protein isoform X2 n=1 Tax=Nothobranchius furzeri TaxID=105023 RepID=UPI003904979C
MRTNQHAELPLSHTDFDAVCLLLNMATSLVYFAGVFISSSQAVISPFLFCQTSRHAEVTCSRWQRSSPDEVDSERNINFVATLLILCFYAPLAFVAFALLAVLLAAYAKDRSTLKFSMVCQAASSTLLLTGIVGFLLSYQSYVTWEDLTLWFYLCVGVQLELVVTTVLTGVAGKNLMP